jgi:hypothetical protein
MTAIEELEKLAREMGPRSPELAEHITALAARLRTEERDTYDSLLARQARAIEALRLLVHAWENRTNMADGLTAAREAAMVEALESSANHPQNAYYLTDV